MFCYCFRSTGNRQFSSRSPKNNKLCTHALAWVYFWTSRRLAFLCANMYRLCLSFRPRHNKEPVGYNANKDILRKFYDKYRIGDYFQTDNAYLENAYKDIEHLWLDNLALIKTVNYLMIAEAPLWGKDKSYIYNPDTPNSQFFYKQDIGEILGITIHSKQEFLSICNELGLIVIDISPFAFNTTDTHINYRKHSKANPCGLTPSQYVELVKRTTPFYLERKLDLIAPKKANNIKVFFRYARVRKLFQDVIAETLVRYGFIKSTNEISDISLRGGGIDRKKLKLLIFGE